METDIDYVPDFPLVPRLLLDYRKSRTQVLIERKIKITESVTGKENLLKFGVKEYYLA